MQDNGGQTCSGGNNWPLRGNKDTVWEGGVRGNGFVTGWGVPESLKNTTNTGLMHVTDWLPTLAHIANVSIGSVGECWTGERLCDGVCRW
jgi:arylsulfatase A-like enzyme